MIRTSGLDHVHVVVRDVDGFGDLMTRLFECTRTMPSEILGLDAINTSVRFGGMVRPCFLDVFEPTGGVGPVAGLLEARGPGVSILSFGVDDLDAAAEHAQTCGLRELSRVGFPGVMKQVQFDPDSSFGVMLEFVEYEPDADETIAEIQRRKTLGLPVEGLGMRQPKAAAGDGSGSPMRA